MQISAVLDGSMSAPPLASVEAKTRELSMSGELLSLPSAATSWTTRSSAWKSAAVIGVEKKVNVPVVAAFWPSSDVVAQQSVSVTTLKPFSNAVRIVDSTQQLVRKPQMATVSMPYRLSSASSVVSGNASSPFLFFTTTSPVCGFIPSQKSPFHVFSVNSESLAHPARMPRSLLGLSLASALKRIGVMNTLPPAARTAPAVLIDFSSMLVLSMTPFTPSCSLPPSVANSF
mmetsp:Transcript_2695/g.5610  ORF Transcript_2695/g.5610 Transcript_2695/m.5610 type:complete len:230 (+) Transcript_2695:16-705(+)